MDLISKLLSAESCEGNRQETFGEGSEDRTYLRGSRSGVPLALPRAKTYRGSELAAGGGRVQLGEAGTQGSEVHLSAFHMQVTNNQVIPKYTDEYYWPFNKNINVRVHMSTYRYA